MPQIFWVRDDRTHRIRKRKVDDTSMAEPLLAAAISENRPAIDAQHGGTVCNSYGYQASTEAVLMVAFPEGYVVAWATEIRANGATCSGVVSANVTGFYGLFHKGKSEEKQRPLEEKLIELARDALPRAIMAQL